MNLKKLVHKCKKQDREAQEKLYRQYSGKLYLLCLKYSSNQQEARDVLQDGFLKIFENIGQYKGKGSFEGWMTRIMINTAIKKNKKQRLFLSINEDLLEQPELEVEEESLSLDFLIKSIQSLPPQYRLVFNLYVLDGHSHKEIATMLGISEGTSKSNLARARMQLREYIDDHLQRKSAHAL